MVEELAKGSTTGLLATLPPGTRVREVFVQARGVAHVDLSGEATVGLPGGSRAELYTVYSIVNTIVTNFPSVSRVRILVDDRPVDSLGGHEDLSRPLVPDMTLVALPAPPAEPTSGASPSSGEGTQPRPWPSPWFWREPLPPRRGRGRGSAGRSARPSAWPAKPRSWPRPIRRRRSSRPAAPSP